MALVTLAEAKRHLNVSDTAHDADVTQKMNAASAAILRYLSGRRIVVSELTSSGGVATVVTPVAHSLTTADTVTIWGTYQPEYNGTFTVTVTDANTFTFVVYGSPESPATGYVGLSTAPSWTDATVPDDVKHAVLLLLTAFYENRGESDEAGAWTAIGRLLSGHRIPALA